MAKVLIIEDDPLIVKIYSTRLRADGYEVISAENGEDGLRLFNAQKPDLVVTDVMMPKVDGFGVLAKIRESETSKNIPVLMYSNLAQEDEMKRAIQMGVTEFIIKANISPIEMIDKIKKYLNKEPSI